MRIDPRQILKSRFEAALKLQNAGNLQDAADAFRGLLKQFPNVPEAHLQLSRIARSEGRLEDRCSSIDQALKLRPDDKTIFDEAISAHSDAENHDRVLELLDLAISREPKNVKPLADKALYLQNAGRFDESEKLFRKLLKKHPNDAQLYRMFVGTTKLKPKDPLIGAMRRLAANPKLSSQDQMHVNFALAKALEDTKAYDKVFNHLRRANGAQAQLWPYDSDARQRELETVVSAQSDLAPLKQEHPGSSGMIFVTGLPRSGTTLVEQIIASHSAVSAGGEIGAALRTAYTLFGAAEDMRALPKNANKELKEFAKQFQHNTNRLRKPGTFWLTDKSIMAFLIYGVLHAALPNARFVIVHRDPRDIALSIYKNHFVGGTHRYANDLADIAEVIKDFRRVTAHWQSNLPDRVSEIRYEELVAEPEAQTRRLIDNVGLPWEDNCLKFHEAGGTVKTLSLHQVRQPIYKSSAKAWQKYETELQPFFDAWGDSSWD